MSIFNEATLESAICQLFEQQGYEHKLGEELHKGLSEVLLLEDIEAYLRMQYGDITENEIQQVILTLKANKLGSIYEENARVFRMITEGFALKREDPKKEPLWIRMINFEKLDDPKGDDSNIFKIVNQVEIVEKTNRRPDAIVYINGLPMVVMEFKSAVKENCTIKNAWTQLTVRYRRDIPTLFRYTAFVVISDGVNNKIGSLYTPYEYFESWNKVNPTDLRAEGIDSLTTMVKGLFAKDRLLAVLRNFIFIPDASQKEEKFVCRYPQFFAATLLYQNILEHLYPGDGKGGTYFGATGCGKSLAMLYLTRLIMRSPRLGSPTILLITDRTDLDDQLSKQFLQAKQFIGEQTILQIESREHLGEMLRGRKSGGVFLTTIQKFSEDVSLLSDRSNIIVISDEAHRSQTNLEEQTKIKFDEHGKAAAVKKVYGFAQYLHKSLPRATYVGFTGTPIDATIEVFGGIVDRYTMMDSVRDGITVQIVYEGRAAKVLADNDKLRQIDEYYDECAEQGSSLEQINKSIRDVANAQSIIGDPRRLQTVAEDFIHHYESRVEEGASVCGKAMFVCMSREIAFDFYKRIIALRPEWAEKRLASAGVNLTKEEEKKLMPIECVKLVMTGNKDDQEELAKLLGNDNDRKVWAEQFKNPKSNFRIVILVDMWLTGFDVPCLDTMYIDKPIQKHTLIQTISRVNRVYPGKTKGLVVDYIGFKKRMNLALKQYGGVPKQGGGEEEDDPTLEFPDFLKIVRDELESLATIIYPFDDSDFYGTDPIRQLKCLNKAANFILLTEKTKNLFMAHSKRLREAYNICMSSDEITKEERDKTHFYMAVRAVIAKLTKGDAPDVETMDIHAKKLMEEALMSDGVEEVVKIVEDKHGDLNLFDPEHVARIERIKLPNIRRKLLERLLRQQISEYHRVNRIKALEFAKRLNELLEEYNDRSDDAVFAEKVMNDVTGRIVELIKELNKDRTSYEQLGIDYEEKAFYDILKAVSDEQKFNYPEDKMISLAKEMKKIIESKAEYTDAFKREDIRAEMSFAIIVKLAENDYPPVGNNYDVIYQKVIQQAENFKKYDVENGPVIHKKDQLEAYHKGLVAEPTSTEDGRADLTLSEWMKKESQANAKTVNLASIPDDVIFLFGCIRDVEHMQWIFQKKNYTVEEKYYNVRQGDRHGAVRRTNEVKHAEYAVLYNLENPSQYLVYRLDTKHHVWDEEEMKKHQYAEPHGKYYIYKLEEQVNIAGINVPKILNRPNLDEGMPVYISAKEIKK